MEKEKKAKLKSAMESKIAEQFSDFIQVSPGQDARSREYQQFKDDNIAPSGGMYETLCKFFGQLPAIDAPKPLEEKITAAINRCNLSITVKEAMAFAIYAPLLFAAIACFITLLVTKDTIMTMVVLIGSLSLIIPAMNYPSFLLEKWRMKAGNQMVLAVFYVVTYMRHTSNLERAIEFASDHIGAPLALDFRKLLWDVETEKYESLQAALEVYLGEWRGINDPFIEAMHLVESSLYEEDERRRLETLDKSLDIILDQTYERMLHYAHNLQSPITTLHMLGVILPILGLVILPLMIAFIPEVRWYHVAFAYNIIIPVLVYALGVKILTKRPSGYGGSEIDENNPELLRRQKQANKILGMDFSISPKVLAGFMIVICLVIGFFPIWGHMIAKDFDMGFGPQDRNSDCGRRYCLFGYHIDTNPNSPTRNQEIGPYGLGASLLSLFVPLGIGLGLALYYSMRSQNVIEIRRKTEQLEDEFGGALFQMSNRLDDGMPPEAAVSVVAASMPSTVSGNFFAHVALNIQKLGISLQDAIFNPQIGALLYYPSNLIESSMKVLIESAKKGPRICSQALNNIGRYLKEMHKVNERLQDLMAEVLASMRSQINFLTPIIAGIVIGITSMITNILSQLSRNLGETTRSVGSQASTGGLANISDFFAEGLATFYFQIIVGLYVVQIVFILTVLINGIKNGVDPLEERYMLGKNLFKAVLLYILIAASVTVVFNVIASSIVSRSLG